MQIIEHQNICLDNLLCYRRQIRHSDILKLARYICENLQALGLEQNGRVIFTEKKNNKTDDTVYAEILIPVKGTVCKCEEFQYEPIFRLDNAVAIRHEGSPERLGKTENVLYEYLATNCCKPVTQPYYVIIRNDAQRCMDNIIDIYIGIAGRRTSE